MTWRWRRTDAVSGSWTTSHRCANCDEKVLAGNAYLFAPELAYRVRWNTNTDTPLPPDVPAGQNPPDGAIFNYYLKSSPSQPVTLEVVDEGGKVVRRFSSADPVPPPDPQLNIPSYWLRPVERLSNAGRLPSLRVGHASTRRCRDIKPEYPISAVDDNTPPAPTSPWIMPGQYRVVLTVEGQKYIRPLTVEMDPRVKTSLSDLQKQFDLSQQVYQSVLSLQPVVEQAAAARTQLNAMRAKSTGTEAAKLEEVSKQLATLEGGGRRRRGGPVTESLTSVRDSLLQIFTILQEVDAPPTTQATASAQKLQQSTTALIAEWKQFQQAELAPLKIQP